MQIAESGLEIARPEGHKANFRALGSPCACGGGQHGKKERGSEQANKIHSANCCRKCQYQERLPQQMLSV